MSFRRHLVRWEEEFADRGLVVIEVSGGEFASIEESRKQLAKSELKHPVLWDQGNRNHNNYGTKNWPAAYLIGADGIVFWQGNPARLSARSEETQKFRQLLEDRLREIKKSDR